MTISIPILVTIIFIIALIVTFFILNQSDDCFAGFYLLVVWLLEILGYAVFWIIWLAIHYHA